VFFLYAIFADKKRMTTAVLLVFGTFCSISSEIFVTTNYVFNILLLWNYYL